MLITDQNPIGHPKEKSGAHNARNCADVQFQPMRVGNRANVAIENVIAIVRHKQVGPVSIGNRLAAKCI
jgi:hypothetical protein